MVTLVITYKKATLLYTYKETWLDFRNISSAITFFGVLHIGIVFTNKMLSQATIFQNTMCNFYKSIFSVMTKAAEYMILYQTFKWIINIHKRTVFNHKLEVCHWNKQRIYSSRIDEITSTYDISRKIPSLKDEKNWFPAIHLKRTFLLPLQNVRNEIVAMMHTLKCFAISMPFCTKLFYD